MSEENLIKAERRTEFGKGAARRIRRADMVPAVVYGGGADPVHINLPGHATMMATKVDNALLSIDFEGETRLALVKDIQRDPIRPEIKHLDLVRVKKGEKVSVEVSVVMVGEAAPDTFVDLDAPHVRVLADATQIPESIEVSIEGLGVGDQVLAGDLVLPAGVELEQEADWLIVNVSAATSAEELEAELEEAEEAAGIEKDESETEDEAPAEEQSEE